MKNFKSTEKLMTLNSRRENQLYDNAFRELIKVFRFYDERDKSCHCKIIDSLYNENHKRYTYMRIAFDSNISDNALRRYRELYTQWFNYLLNYPPVDKINEKTM